jgi:fatty-acyl-CoA synthase
LGHGEVPVREMLEVLAVHGYSGPVSVEWEKRWHPEIEEPEVALPQHIALLRTWVDEIWGGAGGERRGASATSNG